MFPHIGCQAYFSKKESKVLSTGFFFKNMFQVLSEGSLFKEQWPFSLGSEKRKSHNDDKLDHGQEKRRP